MGNFRSAEQDIEHHRLPSIQTGDDIQIALLNARLASIRLLIARNPVERNAIIDQLSQAREKLGERADYYRRVLISGAEERAQFESVVTLIARYFEGATQLESLSRLDHEQAVVFANNELPSLASAAQEQLNALREINTRGANIAGMNATEIYSKSMGIITLVLVTAVLMTIAGSSHLRV